MSKWLNKLGEIQAVEPGKCNTNTAEVFLDFNQAKQQREPEEETLEVKKMATCLHGAPCRYLGDKNICRRVGESVFSLEACPLRKSLWFTVRY